MALRAKGKNEQADMVMRRQVIAVDRQYPAHAGLIQFDISGRGVRSAGMHDAFAHRTEDKAEHVVEMHAYGHVSPSI